MSINDLVLVEYEFVTFGNRIIVAIFESFGKVVSKEVLITLSNGFAILSKQRFINNKFILSVLVLLQKQENKE